MCVVCGPRSKAVGPDAQLASIVADGRSFMPTPPQSNQLFAGSRCLAQSRQREAMFTESPPMERSGMMAGCVFVFPGSRDQQAAKSSDGVSV